MTFILKDTKSISHLERKSDQLFLFHTLRAEIERSSITNSSDGEEDSHRHRQENHITALTARAEPQRHGSRQRGRGRLWIRRWERIEITRHYSSRIQSKVESDNVNVTQNMEQDETILRETRLWKTGLFSKLRQLAYICVIWLTLIIIKHMIFVLVWYELIFNNHRQTVWFSSYLLNNVSRLSSLALATMVTLPMNRKICLLI